jgi:hypothetical protein
MEGSIPIEQSHLKCLLLLLSLLQVFKKIPKPLVEYVEGLFNILLWVKL